MSIEEILKRRILVLDGAMGTMIQAYNLQEDDFRGERFADHSHALHGNNDLLSITRPDIILEIHQQYLEAGADIIETNTFNSNAISQADYGLSSLDYELNFESAKLARSAADQFSSQSPDKHRFVAGILGPTNRTSSISSDVEDPGARSTNFDELRQGYYQQAKGLIDGGVDLLMIETIFDTLNAKAAIYAIDQFFCESGRRLPVMISGTITDSSGRTLSGQTPEAFLISVSHLPLLSIGLNCALGAKQLRPYLEELSEKSDSFVSVHPNAGLPNEFGEYDQNPSEMAEQIREFLNEGLVNIVGGCCGTTPEHIKTLSSLVESFAPRTPPPPRALPSFSGLEALQIFEGSNFINVGERTNVSGSRQFAKLIKAGDYEKALAVARQQIDNGAQIIDINVDEGMLDSKQVMQTFLNLLASDPEISRVPIMIDSSDWSVLEAGLKCIQGKGIVNSISLKDGEDCFIERAREIKRYGSAVVVMAFDESGQADSYERKIEICKRAYDLLVNEVGLKPTDIIFDPNILTIGTGIKEHDDYALAFIKATKWIKQNLPSALVSGGVSNVSFSFRGNDTIREAMHSVFLYHAIHAGLDMGIVNAGMIGIYDEIPKELLELTEDLVLNRRPDATERLLAFADANKGEEKQREKITDAWRNEAVQERLAHSLVKGISDFIEQDVEQARQELKAPLRVIDRSLDARNEYSRRSFW